MPSTRVSFIHELGGGGENAWRTLDEVYRPLILHWLRRYEVQNSDADDIAQEVMTVVARKVDEFDHNGRVGAFRSWLRTITAHVARKYLDKKNRQPEATGSSVFQEMLEQLASDASEVSRRFDQQHDQFVLTVLLRRVSKQFQPTTIKAFQLHAIEGRSAAEVAGQLGVKPQTVYVAKARVLHSLREMAANFMEESSLC